METKELEEQLEKLTKISGAQDLVLLMMDEPVDFPPNFFQEMIQKYKDQLGYKRLTPTE